MIVHILKFAMYVEAHTKQCASLQVPMFNSVYMYTHNNSICMVKQLHVHPNYILSKCTYVGTYVESYIRTLKYPYLMSKYAGYLRT